MTNEFSLDLYDALWEEYELMKKDINSNMILTGLFFHDIMALLTSYFIKIKEIKYNLVMNNLVNERLTSFPYIDYYDILNNLDYSNKQITPLINKDLNYRFKIIEKVSSILNTNGKKIGIGSMPAGINMKPFVFEIIRNGHEIIFLSKNNFKIDIPKFEYQLKSLLDRINLFIPKSFNNKYLFNLMKNYFSKQNISNIDLPEIDLFISGEIMAGKNMNRLYAASYYEKGVRVVGTMHGYATGMLNEPNNGYGEYSYISDLVMYGQSAMNHNLDKYKKPLTNINNYHYISDKKIKEIYDPKKIIIKFSEFTEPKILYVPTLFCGFGTYGPYRQIPDKLYFDWMKNLAKNIPNISFKLHPKGYKKYDLGLNIKFINGYLEDILEDINVFIFDYISSAFTLACATDKPIIFFNLGINNITDEAEIAIRNRCIWIDIDTINDQNLYSKVLNKADQKLENTYTEKFCIAKTNDNLEKILVNIVDS